MEQVRAWLDDRRTVRVTISRQFYDGSCDRFYIESGSTTVACVIEERLELLDGISYTLWTEKELLPSDELILWEEHGCSVPVCTRFITRTSWFEETYSYNGPLGAEYDRQATIFRVWAPTALEVQLILLEEGQRRQYPMTRTDCGVHELRLPGNWKNTLYKYFIRHNGTCTETIDPYGLSSNANGRWSAVIDPHDVVLSPSREALPEMASPCDAVIYECNVRDLTSRETSGTEVHGKFISLMTEGTSYNGWSTGLSYLQELGITHVQFQPVLDFVTVDEKHPYRGYNWGYDPLQFFALEGSYSTAPDTPVQRMKEFAVLVRTLHDHGIRVIVDVVFNHVYDMECSALEQCVPYYYFRYAGDTRSNGSFCGNDLDSGRFMVRKLIIDAVCSLVDLYDVDGFRFDLMGILDVGTMNRIELEVHARKPDALIYGEGWDMPTALAREEKAIIANESMMPGIGTFNDLFRDIVKGGTTDDRQGEAGFLSGSPADYAGFQSAMAGMANPALAHSRYLSPAQSINGPETHDNATLFDKLAIVCRHENEMFRVARQKLILCATLFAQGIPFLHAGVEFCGTKHGNTNSYRAGDIVNGMDWSRRGHYSDVVDYVKAAISLRKELPELRLYKPEDVSSIWADVQNGLNITGIRGIRIIFNPKTETEEYHFSGRGTVLFDEHGRCERPVQDWLVAAPVSVIVMRME